MADTEREIRIVVKADGTVATKVFNDIKQQGQQMATGLKGTFNELKSSWLAVSAAIAGTLYTLKTGWDLAKKAAEFEDQKSRLNSLAGAYSKTADGIVSDIKRVTDGQIAMADIIDISAQAMQKGLLPDKLIELAKYADALGDTLRTSTAEGFRELADAAALGRTRTLANIVGIIDLEASLGKAAKGMNDVEQASARVDIMMKILEKRFPAVGREAKSMADKMEMISATIEDLQLTIGSVWVRALAVGGTAVNFFTMELYALEEGFSKIIKIAAYATDAIGLTTDAVLKMTKHIAESTKGREEAEKRMKAYWDIVTMSSKGMVAISGMVEQPVGKYEEGKKTAFDWIWELAKLKANMMADEEQMIEKLKKEEQDRWEQNIKDQVAYDEYMRQSAEEQTKTIRQIQDLEIAHQLAVINLKEQSFEISAREANEKRLHLFEQELKNLNQQYEETIGIADKDLERLEILAKIDLVNGKILDSLKLQDELSDSVLNGLIEGINRYLRDAQTGFQGGLQIVNDVTAGMKNAFDSFFDYTSDKFMDFKELTLDILHDIYTALVRTLITEPFIKGFAGLIPTKHTGGLVMHAGGEIPKYVPRFHFGGLNSDERLTVNKVGERYITKEQNEWLTNMVKGGQTNVEVAINVENKTGLPVKATQGGMNFDGKKYVKSIIFELMTTDPDFRNSVGRR